MDKKDGYNGGEDVIGVDGIYDDESDFFVSEAQVDYMRMLDGGKLFSYDEYLDWDKYDERWELLDGVPYLMSAPTIDHQGVVMSLSVQIGSYLRGKKCRIFSSPFEVRLKTKTTDKTALFPDLVVLCNKEKSTKRGCIGAPDMVVEVLSPSTAKRDKEFKYKKYLQSGVKEYWIIDPVGKILTVNILNGNQYVAHIYKEKDTVKVHVLDDCVVDLVEVFEEW